MNGTTVLFFSVVPTCVYITCLQQGRKLMTIAVVHMIPVLLGRARASPTLIVTTRKSLYSRASDNGPSEKRTTSLQRTSSVLRIEISIVVILKQPPRSGRFLIPDSGQNSNSQRDISIQNCLRIADKQENTPIK